MKKYTILALFVGVLQYSVAHAGAPLVYGVCGGVDTATVPGAVLYDQNCSAGYLLPGPEGELKVTGGFFTISNAMCSAVKELEQAALGRFGNVEERKRRKKELERNIEKVEKKRREKYKSVETYRKILTSLSGNIDSLEIKKTSIEAKLSSNCGQGRESNAECLILKWDLEDLEKKIEQNEQKRSKVIQLVSIAENELSEYVAEYEALWRSLTALNNSTTDTELQLEAKRQLAEMKVQHGATISVTLRTKLQESYKNLVRVNAGSSINLQEMRFTGGGLYAAPVINDFNDAETAGVIKVVFPGLPVDEGGTLFVNAGAAQLKMDAVSACNTFDYERPNSSDLAYISKQLSANVVAKAYVRYNALLKGKIVAKFEHDKFYELLAVNKTKNGFFKTKKIKEIINTMESTQALHIQVLDEGNVFGPGEKSLLIEGIKSRIVQDALERVGAEQVGIDLKANPADPSTGASVASKHLKKCPNKWCQVGASVLDVAHSIFGGSESRQRFVDSLQISNTETYSEGRAFEYVTDIVFIPVGN
ncbi:MAG: hypothetical protein AB2809_20010 [Candidatus Thiodiazotropha sp.]